MSKIVPGAVGGRTFSLPGSFLVDFWALAGSQNDVIWVPKAWCIVVRRLTFADFVAGRVPEGSRTDSGGSGDPPGPDFEKILRYFFAASVGILSGFVRFRRDVAGIRIQPQ